MKENSTNKKQYEDIINLEHHVSGTHNHMSVHDRAAQFSPFAALTGYDGAIKEAARETNQRVELDETAKILLDEKLRIVQEQLSTHQEIELIYFRQDEKKAGGAYIKVRGTAKKIDKYERAVVMEDGIRIPIEDIMDITGEMFQSFNDFFI